LLQIVKDRKKLLVILIIVVVCTAVVSSHPLQLALMEHISLREFYIRMIARGQNLNTSSAEYGNFGSVGNTVSALDALEILEGLDSINQSAVFDYIIGQNETGPVDNPITGGTRSARIKSAYQIVHITVTLERLSEVPDSLMDEIRAVVKEELNRTSDCDWRAFVFETAQLIDETEGLNFSMHEIDILNDLRKHLSLESFEGSPEAVHTIWFDLIAYNELFKMWKDQQNAAGFHLPDDLRNIIAYYILSLWNPEHNGFSQDYQHKLHFTPELWYTYLAVDSYDMISKGLHPIFSDWRHDAFRALVGQQFERLVSFVQARQNRYGLVFRFPDEVDDRVNSLKLHTTYHALAILETIDRLDILNQTVRWPPQPTLIETIVDGF
jgi:hypothetical protein